MKKKKRLLKSGKDNPPEDRPLTSRGPRREYPVLSVGSSGGLIYTAIVAMKTGSAAKV